MAPDNTLPQQPNELFIDGVLYDCTNFRHPGGSVIKYYLGSGDATETYQQFHIKLPKADKYLKMLPHRPAPPQMEVEPMEQKRLDKLSRDFKALHEACVTEGLFDACWLHILYRFADIFFLHAVGLLILFRLPALWPIALIMLGVVEGRCGWWMHEAGHYSATGIPWVDIKMQEIVYGLGCGMSGAWWRVQHNKHHATPQKHRHDVDLETLPLIAFNKVIARRGKKSVNIRRWISLQMYLFGPVTCSLVALYWQLFLHVRHVIRTRRYTEGVSILLRWIIVGFVCHQLQVSFWQGLGGVLFSQAFGAAYIFVSFSLNHSHLPMLPEDQHAHFVEYAAIYTMDVAPSWFVNWFMGYLNYQVEHHLFPCMPQFRFVKLAPRVRKLFEENGLAYDSRPYMQVLRTTFKNLGDVAQYMVEKD
ncbi:delta-5 fatty acid desaturase [Leptomonas seymouri]|uniref:Delta-5 fatty acid desaturase n=1 Tax=Leptomonas seymouri TaxID=5684 RepID=A0A0N1PAQ6_LEPSE|nr:delta-5 fatty acid desaturase [Leptomonas seymouri]|eukprot:KPI84275.1 delta-5 fatty acid desaturase [Leptomonas seymouri]